MGDGVSIFDGTSDIIVGEDSVCYLDDSTTFHGNVELFAIAGKHIFIGKDCMLSYRISLRTSGGHFMYSCLDNSRISKAGSIYLGDHVWFGMESAIMKQIFIASGAIIGMKSVLAGNKIFYSNTTNAGIPCKEIAKNVFWIRDHFVGWDKQMEAEFESYNDDSFKYAFEKDKFLNPSLIDKKLESFDNSIDKLIFLYNYIYCNHNKNRFALFCDSDFRDCALYCEDENAFAKIEFESMMQINYE